MMGGPENTLNSFIIPPPKLHHGTFFHIFLLIHQYHDYLYNPNQAT